MNRKSGFTLVELLAVIALLGAILLVSVPSVINTLKNNEKKEYENFEKTIKNATELYIERNRNLYPELDNIGGKVELQSTILIDKGYLKSDLKNPKNDKLVTNYMIVIEVGNDEIITYNIKENE